MNAGTPNVATSDDLAGLLDEANAKLIEERGRCSRSESRLAAAERDLSIARAGMDMEKREIAMIKDKIAEHERAAANLRAVLGRKESARRGHRATDVESDADKRAYGGDWTPDEGDSQ